MRLYEKLTWVKEQMASQTDHRLIQSSRLFNHAIYCRKGADCHVDQCNEFNDLVRLFDREECFPKHDTQVHLLPYYIARELLFEYVNQYVFRYHQLEPKNGYRYYLYFFLLMPDQMYQNIMQSVDNIGITNRIELVTMMELLVQYIQITNMMFYIDIHLQLSKNRHSNWIYRPPPYLVNFLVSSMCESPNIRHHRPYHSRGDARTVLYEKGDEDLTTMIVRPHFRGITWYGNDYSVVDKVAYNLLLEPVGEMERHRLCFYDHPHINQFFPLPQNNHQLPVPVNLSNTTYPADITIENHHSISISFKLYWRSAPFFYKLHVDYVDDWNEYYGYYFYDLDNLNGEPSYIYGEDDAIEDDAEEHQRVNNDEDDDDDEDDEDEDDDDEDEPSYKRARID